jgi:hypothetical protein
MRCNEFDAHIDEMLSGILHPDANQHMRQCERCTSHYRARAAVQNGLRQLASAAVPGPSRATDRAVMESYRRLQEQRRAAASGLTLAAAAPMARRFTFPSRSMAPALVWRTWWTGAAAAAAVFAVLGSSFYLGTGRPTVSAPITATAPAAQQDAAVLPRQSVAAARLASRHPSRRLPQLGSAVVTSSSALSSIKAASETALAGLRPSPAAIPILAASASPTRPTVAVDSGASNYDSMPVTQQLATASPVLRLASTVAAGNAAEAASSTWPGYSNLMYCDPVVCSGPMQVVHIKVPIGQVRPNLGQTVGNTFVNAEVVVGPDGVARAIRVAN